MAGKAPTNMEVLVGKSSTLNGGLSSILRSQMFPGPMAFTASPQNATAGPCVSNMLSVEHVLSNMSHVQLVQNFVNLRL